MSSQDGNRSPNTADSEAVPTTRSPPTRRHVLHPPDPIEIGIANTESSPTNLVAAGHSATALSDDDSLFNSPDTTPSPGSAPPHPPTAPVPSPHVAQPPERYTPAEKRERELIFTVLPHAPRAASTYDLRRVACAPRRAQEGLEGPWTTWYCNRCGLRKDFPIKLLNAWRWKPKCDDPIDGCGYEIFYKKRSKKVLVLGTD